MTVLVGVVSCAFVAVCCVGRAICLWVCGCVFVVAFAGLWFVVCVCVACLFCVACFVFVCCCLWVVGCLAYFLSSLWWVVVAGVVVRCVVCECVRCVLRSSGRWE